MNVFAERYFYISPDEAARRVFDDAAAIFFGRDGMIAASRAPAAVLRPGSPISGCFASGRLPTVTDGALFGRAHGKPDRSAATWLSGDLFLYGALGLPGVSLAVFPVAGEGSVGAAALPPSLESVSAFEERAVQIADALPGDPLYFRIADAAVEAARFAGAGISVGVPVGCALSALGFDSGAFEALMLTSALLFRRASRLRGFNLAIGETGADAAGITAPVLRLDALLDGGADAAMLPELAAMRRIAEAADVFFDTCSEPSADGSGERLYVYFSPSRISDPGDGLKSARPAGGEEDAHAAAMCAFDGIPAGAVY